MRESVKMKMFNHSNVMNLLGVCLDAGPAPYIVLPFMSGGDLLSHIKGRRGSLVVECDADEGTVRMVSCYSAYLINRNLTKSCAFLYLVQATTSCLDLGPNCSGSLSVG